MKILVVEDDSKTAQFVAAGFREVGFVCDIAKDGVTGLASAVCGDYDAATVDIMLPRLNGLDMIRRLRAKGSRLPIIILSARGDVHEKVDGLNAGGDDYLAKPFSITELVARVQALLRRTGPANLEAADKLCLKGLCINLVTRRVTFNDERIDLQPLELQLLEYLMRNKGRVVSKTTIMEHVWDYSFDPKTNVVEARVCRLREKLGEGGALIRTVRGFGYVLGD